MKLLLVKSSSLPFVDCPLGRPLPHLGVLVTSGSKPMAVEVEERSLEVELVDITEVWALTT